MELIEDDDVDIDEKDNKGSTALMLAAFRGSEDIVRMLVENGAKVNLTTDLGCNAFYFAVKEGHKDVVNYLAAHNANVNHKNQHGHTSPQCAAANDDVDSMRVIFDHAPYRDKDIRDHDAPSLCCSSHTAQCCPILGEYGG